MAEANKTEKATPKKRKDERKKGNSFQSKDVISVAVLVVAFVLISKLGTFVAVRLQHAYESQVLKSLFITDLTVATCGQTMRELLLTVFICALPILLIICLTTVVMSGVQTRFLFSPELLKFKFNRISFLQGVKRMVSLRSVVQLIKSLLKVLVVFLLIYSSIKGMLVVAPDMLSAGVDENIEYMVDTMMSMVFRICLLFVAVAVLDWAYQRYDYEQKLKMTKQEVKDEYKQTEGDPFIKGKMKERQRKLSMNRMIQQVPTADVVVRNPTHFAIALKYDINKDPAPLVVAKGQDLLAERIIKVATENNVLMLENVPLAHSLYAAVEVNQYIPGELYNAVAEVMAWVYKTRKENEEKKANRWDGDKV